MLILRWTNIHICIGSQVDIEQVESGLPGLAKEAKDLCESMGLPNILKSNVDKTAWKKLLKERAVAVFDEHMEKQLETKFSKLQDIKNDRFSRKDYL